MTDKSIVLSYSSDYNDLNTTFLHAYVDYKGYLFKNISRTTIITENKLKVSDVTPLLSELGDFLNTKFSFNIGKYQLSKVIGVDHDNYEDAQDGEEGVNKLDIDDKTEYLDKLYIFSTNDIAIFISQVVVGYYGIQLGIVDAYDNQLNTTKNAIIDEIFDFFMKKFEKYKKSTDKRSNINFICTSNHGGFYLNSTKIEKNKDLNLEDHYNDDFIEVANKIDRKIKEKNSNGIILLHGKHGTGKTSYLRHLIHTINKKILYVPPNISGSLAEPSFLTFLMKHKNSVLIIEDAENVIKTREAGENQAVSNLLNITDGILGDGLNFQVICTFNTGFDQIDPALKRKGRMIAQYEFGNLSKDKTEKLVKKLYGDEIKPEFEEMSLAEIYNMQDDNYDSDKKPTRGIGFLAEL